MHLLNRLERSGRILKMMGAISGLRFCLQIIAFTLFMIQNEALDLFESPLYCNLGVRLEGFVAETYQLRSKTQCALKCSENPDCQSFSFETLNKTADFKTCEINTATTDRRGNNIVNDTGFIYYEKVIHSFSIPDSFISFFFVSKS